MKRYDCRGSNGVMFEEKFGKYVEFSDNMVAINDALERAAVIAEDYANACADSVIHNHIAKSIRNLKA